MRTLHRYLARQVLQTLVMTVLVFTFVLLLGNVLREVLALLITRQATLPGVAHAIALLIPYVMVFALPMGLLTATLLVMGRFSADHELTAARAGGISLVALVAPLLALGVLFSALSAVVNCEIAPRCRVAYKELLFGLGIARPASFLTENRFITDYPNFVIYVGKRHGNDLENVLIYQMEQGEMVRRFRAPHGSITVDDAEKKILFQLTDTTVFMRPLKQAEAAVHAKDGSDADWLTFSVGELTVPVDFKTVASPDAKPKLSEMTFSQLRAELRAAEAHGVDATPAKVQLHRMVAFSFACLGFTLVGIPLGIRAHRRETSAGMAMALVLVLAYYSFIILSQALEMRPSLHPHLLAWVPNFLFQGIGAWLLWRANKGI